ncbi:hypothetical protein [Microbispora sp. NPDC049125]|uniref:hypothetical protein n=1 Tax=Microbispora sp. NPDC049125 TaxID=3154929 RepID=UPI0034674A17
MPRGCTGDEESQPDARIGGDGRHLAGDGKDVRERMRHGDDPVPDKLVPAARSGPAPP